jgi:hypothetical protein
VKASDNVLVTRVLVRTWMGGEDAEQGEVLQMDPGRGWWQYATDIEGQIVAEAWDLAGDRSKLVL